MKKNYFLKALKTTFSLAPAHLRQELQMAHDRLQQLILEMLRITIATEEELSRRLGFSVAGDCTRGNTPKRTASGTRDTQSTGLAFVLYLLFIRICCVC